MMKKLLDITNQLLDLGKRNRLLNYKDTGLKSLTILNKNTEEVFRGIKAGREYTFFATDQAISKYHSELPIEEKEQDNTLQYSNQLVIDICNKQLDVRELLSYKRGYSLDKTLKSLMKEHKFAIQEKGINSLYMSFGFVHYVEEEIEYLAPLLLTPVELNNETGSYTLCLYEDDTIVNPTLAYYFSATYQTEFPPYKNDAMSTYFDKIKEILPEGITLDNGIAIGIYSFFKMNMYNDLMNNKEIVFQNDNIRILLGISDPIETTYETQPIYPVVNYDSSQLEAIQWAADGKSFCLQGPPGSGKSQTITNIISSLLGAGKKILFVSEKIAALRVVFENLRRAGLSDFAIELHSNKTNKKDFIENLYKTAVLPKYDISFKSKLLSFKHESVKSKLKAYENILHSFVPGLDITLIDLFSKYLNIDAQPMDDFEIRTDGVNLFDIDKIIDLFIEYTRYSRTVGYDYRNSKLYELNLLSEDYVLYDLVDDLTTSISYLNKVINMKNLLNAYLGYDIKNVEDLDKYLPFVDALSRVKTYHPNYLIKKHRIRLINAIEVYISNSSRLKTDLFNIYNKAILNEDLENIIKDISENNKGLFKNKAYKDALGIVYKHRNNKNKDNIIIEELNELLEFKKRLYQATEAGKIIQSIIGDYRNMNLRQVLTDLRIVDSFPDISLGVSEHDEIKRYYNENLLGKAKEEKARLVSLSRLFNTNIMNILTIKSEFALKKINELYLEKDLFLSYVKLNKCVDIMRRYEVLDYLNAYLSSNQDISLISLVYEKTFFKRKIKEVFANSELLSDFDGMNEDELIEQFVELDEKILKINRDIIISEISQKRPDDSIIEGSMFKVLDKEHNKLRRQLPIRTLLDQIFELALDIKPVFLMSPLSVSTYLASSLNMFDCVIFDEASQIFASDALGSIYRAKQCIVIGDTKQMPPTSFFQAGVEDGSEKEYDLESILDKASERFPMAALKWHYRSRSEELITFSNASFYDSNLITVPQAKKHEVGFGIDFYYVEDGRYDSKTRTNVIEAKKVCDMVFEHLRKSKESLGVVAFSNVQAELIADLVDKRIKKNPALAELLTKNEDEPFFVKNLESVQGDERDRIIFSICYGYNEESKFYQRFGPLNNLGGERRLNVAITRAKYNVSIVSSILASDIKIPNSEAKGVMLLKSYLDFAQNVVTSKNFDEDDNGIVKSVKEYLESLGYEVFPNYGSSSFKVDLAVKKDDEFVLAIMIDGKSNYSNNITDKYRLEKLLLERLGWKYIKLYSTSWINNNEAEKERIIDVLNSETTTKTSVSDNNDSFLKEDVEEEGLEVEYAEYYEVDIERAKEDLNNYGLNYVVKDIIRTEAPIHESYLYKKVALIMDRAKPTPQIKKAVDEAIPQTFVKIDDFYFENPIMKIRFRVNLDRDITQIHPDELADGIYNIVKKNNGITIDGCYRNMAQMLGYEKIMPNVRKALDDALQHLIIDHKVNESKDKLYIV